MLLPIFTEQGELIRATCTAHEADGEWSVTIESRGGTIGTRTERNADYSLGFQLIVQRLAQLHAVIEDAVVESADPHVKSLSEAERRLDLSGMSYPVELNLGNQHDVEDMLRQAQANVGSRATTGGNRTRRVRLRGIFRTELDASHSFADHITGARALGPLTDQDIEALANEESPLGAFQPSSITDARRRVLTSIVRRQGQPRFREALLKAYDNQCPISRCDAVPVLEAAHIIAYLGVQTNQLQNGLLLRADLHTLFDRGLLGIDPTSWTVVLHPSLERSEYATYSSASFQLPFHRLFHPSEEALTAHLRASGLPVGM